MAPQTVIIGGQAFDVAEPAEMIPAADYQTLASAYERLFGLAIYLEIQLAKARVWTPAIHERLCAALPGEGNND